jgi:FHA domain
VDALLEIQKQQQGTDALIEKAKTSKGKVPEAVFERVMRDYEARRKAAEDAARPLRQKARTSLARLSELHARLKGGLDAAQLDQSELQFRHEIGELSAEEFEKRRKGAEDALLARQKEFDEADKLRQRFIEVLPAEPEPPAAAPPAAPEPAPDSSTMVFQAPELRPADVPDFGTVVLTKEETSAIAEEPDFGTVVAPNASLVRQEPDGRAGPSYHLGMLVTIGRTPDNEIAIELPEVSRRHARLAFTEGGYVLQDLNSNNGTYLNGERTSEARLQDGDQIQIGPILFIFTER